MIGHTHTSRACVRVCVCVCGVGFVTRWRPEQAPRQKEEATHQVLTSVRRQPTKRGGRESGKQARHVRAAQTWLHNRPQRRAERKELTGKGAMVAAKACRMTHDTPDSSSSPSSVQLRHALDAPHEVGQAAARQAAVLEHLQHCDGQAPARGRRGSSSIEHACAPPALAGRLPWHGAHSAAGGSMHERTHASMHARGAARRAPPPAH